MQTVETVALIVFAIIVGSLTISFVLGMDFSGIQNSVNSIMSPKSSAGNVRTAGIEGLLLAASECKSLCESGASYSPCGSLLVSTSNVNNTVKPVEDINAIQIQQLASKLNICSDCSFDLNGRVIKENTIVSIKCSESNPKIIIIGASN